MKPGRGKAKGSAFERWICAALSLWVTNGASKDVFWRSAMSGGRATIHVGRGQKNRQAGDICAVAPEGHILTDQYFIECKHLKDLNLTGFVLSDVGPLAKFWKVCVEQATTHGRIPMLIAKQNQQPVMVLTISGTLVPLLTSAEVCRAGVCCQILLFDELMQHPFKISRVIVNESTNQRLGRREVRSLTRHRLNQHAD